MPATSRTPWAASLGALSPRALLAIVCACSLAARVAWLSEPCRTPCRSASDHVLVFDEDYYVGAARAIASVRAPGGSQGGGSQYGGAPRGLDPNAEHPQLAKLVIAGAIELFGDGPFAWRIGSVLAGTVALVGTFALVRAAGGSARLALGAAALMALDNLLLVHGRIATLDIYVAAAMIWAAVLYLRGRALSAGVLLGVGACAKLLAPSALIGLALFELARRVRPRRAVRRLLVCAGGAAVAFVGLLALLDRIAPPYDFSAGRALASGPFHHLAHMLSYAAHQTSPHGPRGIASYPWDWLADYKPIVYLNIDPARPAAGLRGIHPAVHFLGMISPPILLAGVIAMVVAAWRLGHGALGRPAGRAASAERDVALLGLAWTAGTLAPFVALSLLWRRTTYLYYMVVVMPGIYLLAAELVGHWRRRLAVAFWVAVAIAAVVLYPFTPVPSG